jgi:hypothetical protein
MSWGSRIRICRVKVNSQSEEEKVEDEVKKYKNIVKYYVSSAKAH